MNVSHPLLLYTYLQLLDYLTTVAFLAYGVQEANPLVRWLIEHSGSPWSSLLLVKLVAVGLGLAAWRAGRVRLLHKVNWLFAACVVWNSLALIVNAAQQG